MRLRAIVWSSCIIFIIILGSFPHTHGLTTGQRSSSFTLPIKVNLLLYGFQNSSDLIEGLESNLPSHIIHEVIDPGELDPKPTNSFIFNDYDIYRSYQTRIQYTYSTELTDEINSTITDNTELVNASITGGSGPFNLTDDFTIFGNQINGNNFTNQLVKNNLDKGYSLHLINGQQITNNTLPHWYSFGQVNPLMVSNGDTDMRNMGIVGQKGIFYDPSAITPKFDFNHTFNGNISETLNFIIPRVLKIIEHIFIGSPYSFDLWPENFLRTDLHFAQFLIGDLDSDFTVTSKLMEDREAITNPSNGNQIEFIPSGNEYVEFALKDLFPYLSIKFTDFSFRTDYTDTSLATINNLIKQNTVVDLESNRTLIVTSDFAETMKRTIRQSTTIYGESFPSDFYLSSFGMVQQNKTDYLYVLNDGNFTTYENQHIGFGVLNLRDWRDLTQAQQKKKDLIKHQLRIFGKLVGLSELDDNLTSQIESPMSNYGVTENWDYKFTQFEIDTMTRRFGASFNLTARWEMRDIRNAVEDTGYLFWVDPNKDLDPAETALSQGDAYYRLELYTLAVEKYLEAYELMRDGISAVNKTIRSFYNSINFVSAIIVLLYAKNFLNSLSINKKKFYQAKNE